MNCQEYRNIIEDSLDFSRLESPPGIVLRHLDHCKECREHLAACSMSHVALFRVFNEAYSSARLPCDFADRLVTSVRRQRRWIPFMGRLQRRAVAAAVLVLLLCFALAASILLPRMETAVVDAKTSVGMESSLSSNASDSQFQLDSTTTEKEQTMNAMMKSSAALAAAVTAAAVVPTSEGAGPRGSDIGAKPAVALRAAATHEEVASSLTPAP